MCFFEWNLSNRVLLPRRSRWFAQYERDPLKSVLDESQHSAHRRGGSGTARFSKVNTSSIKSSRFFHSKIDFGHLLPRRSRWSAQYGRNRRRSVVDGRQHSAHRLRGSDTCLNLSPRLSARLVVIGSFPRYVPIWEPGDIISKP